MKIESRPVNSILPYGKNAKKHPDKQIIAIANSIKEFGFNQPIVVDDNDVIIVGHGRFLAACFLGLEEVPVLKLSIDEDKARAYRLADNKLNESDWDMQLVVQELKEISLSMLDLTGFDRNLVIDMHGKDDDVPDMPTKSRTEIGDLYEIGPHRILCGDSTQEESYIRLMRDVKADMCFTDPPYNVNYHGSGKNTSTGIMNYKMGNSQFREFLIDSFKNLAPVIKKGAGMYIFHSPKTQKEFEDALSSTGFEVKYQLIWNKPSAGLGAGDYRNKHEPFFYTCHKGGDPLFYGDRTNTTVIDFHKSDQQLINWARKQREDERNGKTTIWTMKCESVKDYVHPTQKPVELIMYAIANSSKVEDVVIDPFLGSGSTMIACEKTNRNCYGIELDTRFIDVIIQRYIDFTGNKEIRKNGEKIIW